MTANAFIKHESPGRLRVSFPDHTNDVEFFTELQKNLAEKYPNLFIKTNPVTGSLLLTLEGEDENIRLLLEKAAQEGLIGLIDNELAEQETVDLTIGIRRTVRFADRLIRDMSKGKLDFKSVVGFSLIGMGIIQIQAGKVLPAALPLFLNAFAFLDVTKPQRRS